MSIQGIALEAPPAPGTPSWFRYMTASKIAAVMDHSPYDSYLSLWLRMNGQIVATPMDDIMRRGHYLEPAVLAWFKDQHPDWTIEHAGADQVMWIHPHYRWAGGTPDGDGIDDDGRYLLEIKSSDIPEEWGDPFTDQIPPNYYDQCQWQMFTSGVRRVRLAVILPHFLFAEYVIEYNRTYIKTMLAAAIGFMTALLTGQRPALDPLDGHAATYKALLELAPGIEARTVQVPASLARDYVMTTEARKDAEYRETAVKSQLAELMGDAKTAMVGKTKICGRQSRGGGTPYIVAARGLDLDKIGA